MSGAQMHFSLSDGERSHPLWARLRAHFEECLSKLRAENDNDKLSEQQTASLRGQIRRLKAIIAMGEAPPMTEE